MLAKRFVSAENLKVSNSIQKSRVVPKNPKKNLCCPLPLRTKTKTFQKGLTILK